MAAKRVGSFAMAIVFLFLFFAVPITQPVNAVAGTIIIGAVIATMAMAGITMVASGLTAAELQGWVSDKLDEWAEDVGSPLDHLINSAGIGVTISGLLSVGTAAAQGINSFISWLQSDMGITDNSIIEAVQGGSSIGTLQGVYLQSFEGWEGQWHFGDYNANIPVFTFRIGSGSGTQRWTGVICISDDAFTINNSNSVIKGDYHTILIFWDNSGNRDITTNPSSPMNENLVPQNVWDYLINQNPSMDNYGGLLLQSGTIILPEVENEDKLFIDVGAYPGSTVTEVTNGVITDVLEGELEVSGEVAEEEPEYVITGPIPVYGLASVFPFCIPFDLYNFRSQLSPEINLSRKWSRPRQRITVSIEFPYCRNRLCSFSLRLYTSPGEFTKLILSQPFTSLSHQGARGQRELFVSSVGVQKSK